MAHIETEVLLVFDLGDEQVAHLRMRFPHVTFRYAPCHSREEVAAQMGTADILFGYYVPDYAANLLEQFPKVRWMQLTGTGYDHLERAILHSGITITNAPLFAIPIAEYVLSSMLTLSKRLPPYAADFRANREWPTNRWMSHVGHELFGRTLGVVGYGGIGQAVAKLGKALGMSVIATRQSATASTMVEGVRVVPVSQLDELLGVSDFVVLSLPLTQATHHLMDTRAFEQMKAGAVLINVARGAVVDEVALVAALQLGQLGGAALDVFEEEPLSPSSPLFDFDNVLLTPHIAGVSSAYHARIADHFARNLELYLAGQPLNCVVSVSS